MMVTKDATIQTLNGIVDSYENKSVLLKERTDLLQELLDSSEQKLSNTERYFQDLRLDVDLVRTKRRIADRNLAIQRLQEELDRERDKVAVSSSQSAPTNPRSSNRKAKQKASESNIALSTLDDELPRSIDSPTSTPYVLSRAGTDGDQHNATTRTPHSNIAGNISCLSLTCRQADAMAEGFYLPILPPLIMELFIRQLDIWKKSSMKRIFYSGNFQGFYRCL